MVIYSTDRPWNYDCSFVGGTGRRKHFRQQVYMVFPPTYSSGHHGSAAYFTTPTAAVRLKLNRSPTARRRVTLAVRCGPVVISHGTCPRPTLPADPVTENIPTLRIGITPSTPGTSPSPWGRSRPASRPGQRGATGLLLDSRRTTSSLGTDSPATLQRRTSVLCPGPVIVSHRVTDRCRGMDCQDR
ncbi:hypothetical protein Bbelb_206910 [Branchiostoma belcheri]|nr:hypothetical protein Bbelb_206910 [Branchiostoma belcheri]